ncbi:MAG TPA: hypothetical protein VD886_19100 [Herpetosiphonaceae bacterium]|nr:hypothetical protein [Herpetosiphonaceae bacterium]
MSKTTRTIHALLIGLALAGCGAGTPSVSPAASPARTPRAVAIPTRTQESFAALAPTATQELPAASAPTAIPPADPTPASGSPTQRVPAEPPAASAIGQAPTATPAFPEQQITAESVGQVELLRTVGFGQAQDAAFSPDQSLLAVATSGGIVWYELPGLRHLRFDPIAGGVHYIRFIDGQTIEAIADPLFGDGRVEQRRVADGGVIESRSQTNPTPDWSQTVESPAGDILASFLPPDSVPTPGVTITRPAANATLYEDSETLRIDFAADNATVALVTERGDVRVLDLPSGQHSEVALPGYSAAAFSPDGQALVTAGRDLTFWDVVSGEETQREPLPFYSYFGMDGTSQRILYSPDGSALTVDGSYGVFEGEVRSGSTWKVGPGGAEFADNSSIGGKGIMNYDTYVGAISPAGRDGAFTSDGTTLEIYRNGALSHTLAWAEQISGLAFSPDGATLAVGDKQGGVRLVVVEDGSVGETFGTAGDGLSFAFSPDSALLAVGGAQGGVELIAVSDGSVRHTVAIGGAAARLSFSPDGRRLAIRGEDAAITVVDLAAAEVVAIVPGAEGSSGGRLVFSADNSLLLESDGDQVHVYGIGAGQLLRTLPMAGDDIAIGPNRRMILARRDGYVELWGIR